MTKAHLIGCAFQLFLLEELDITATVITALSEKCPCPPASSLTNTLQDSIHRKSEEGAWPIFLELFWTSIFRVLHRYSQCHEK
jgi:hypothetical protein